MREQAVVGIAEEDESIVVLRYSSPKNEDERIKRRILPVLCDTMRNKANPK